MTDDYREISGENFRHLAVHLGEAADVLAATSLLAGTHGNGIYSGDEELERAADVVVRLRASLRGRRAGA